jgi:hypothetical protein
MRRPYVISLIVAGVVVFLAISALLARALTLNGDEQSAITSLVQAEASGNPAAVVAAIDGCRGSAACAERANEVAAALRHPGTVSVIDFSPSSGFTLGPTLGTARVAWIAGGSLPRVQCVLVRNSGDVLEGFQVHLLKISVKIPGGDNCPKSY